MLSSYARSEPPDDDDDYDAWDADARELAEAAAVASSPVDEDADEDARRFDPAPFDDSADPDAVVVASGASTLGRGGWKTVWNLAFGSFGGERGGRRRFGIYWRSRARRRCTTPPSARTTCRWRTWWAKTRTWTPASSSRTLRRLQEMPPARFVARRLIFAEAEAGVRRANLLEGDDVAGACRVAATRRLFPAALEMARAEPSVTDPDGIRSRTVAAATARGRRATRGGIATRRRRRGGS